MPAARARAAKSLGKTLAFSQRSSSATSETWLESIACSEKPVGAQSKLASVTRSLMESRTFFSSAPCAKRASNIFEEKKAGSGGRAGGGRGRREGEKGGNDLKMKRREFPLAASPIFIANCQACTLVTQRAYPRLGL